VRASFPQGFQLPDQTAVFCRTGAAHPRARTTAPGPIAAPAPAARWSFRREAEFDLAVPVNGDLGQALEPNSKPKLGLATGLSGPSPQKAAPKEPRIEKVRMGRSCRNAAPQ